MILVMKMTLILFISSVLNLFASGIYSQNTRISLDLKDVAVKEALKAIENASEFYFIYNNELINVDRKVDVVVKEKKIGDILRDIFTGRDVDFFVIDRKIVLAPANLPSDQQQQRSVTGKVTDKNGEPLPGVTVLVKGTTQGTITTTTGTYSLTNIPEGAILLFSFVGMHSLEIEVGNQASINVVMQEEAIGIEEVVAIGYGTQKKVNLTGAVSQIKADEIIKNRPVSSLSTALQGAIPGLQITSKSGRPGEPSSIVIRGTMSITGGSPLVLVDNVPMNIEDLNPADIEAISVLKDASASSIYGGRAAFGVILITTKKGRRNQPVKFNYTSNFVDYPGNRPAC